MGLFSCAPTYTLKSIVERNKVSKNQAVEISEHKQAIETNMESFQKAFSTYKKEDVLNVVEAIYDENAFLNDRIHTVVTKEAIKDYFAKSFEKIEDAKFTILETVYGKKEVYLQWIMAIKLKKIQTQHDFLGMSLFRFNSEGKIIYQQDYWDYSELLGEIKGVKNLVNYAKSKS